jgi:hypothetical protein
VNRKRTILVASFVILAALIFVGTALSQALIAGTGGLAGDNSQTVEPVSASQEDDDTSASVSAGHGDGEAATVDAQKDTDGGDAVVGCIDGSVANGNDGGSASIGNCGGSGSTASGVLDNGTAGGGGSAGLGCIVAELFGDTEGGAQVGSCDASGGGNGGGGGDNGGNPGGDNGSGNGNGDALGSGVAGAETGGGAGNEGGTGPGGGQGGGDEPCATFQQASALTGSGALPFWALGAAAIAAFGLGTVFARRRTKEADPTA